VEVEEPARPCGCGRIMPCVRRIIGRREDVITTPDGRVIPSLFVVFNQVAGISLGQAVQEAPDRLAVRIVRSADYTGQSEADLHSYLRRFLGPAMHIDVEYLSAEALRRSTAGKFRTIISRIPVPSETTTREYQAVDAVRGD
jgi:phenylacetate-CoA ligase